MNRTEKAQLAEELKDKFSRANAAFLTEYRGMTVPMLDELRNKVREGNGEVRVLQNRVAKKAAAGTVYEKLSQSFSGPIAVCFSFKDPVAVAKAVLDCVKDESPLQVRIGSLEGKELRESDVKQLSSLPDRQTLLQMTVSVLQAPIRNFACVMAAVPRDFANVLTAVKDGKSSQ